MTEIEQNTTFRPTSPALEAIARQEFPILDHGFIKVVDYLGNDAAIEEAARISYGKGTRKQSETQALIEYLVQHSHTTPLEMAEIKFHMKLPIFVARQLIRHRTANVNEYSARYSILDKEFYIPEPEVLAAQSTSNKQGRGEVLTTEQAREVREMLISHSNDCYDVYQSALNDPASQNYTAEFPSLARELARMSLSLNYYTQWYWKCDAHNLLHFLRLRLDPHAQYEIRVYAEKMWEIVKLWIPLTANAFENAVINGARLTGRQLKVIRKMLTVSSSTQIFAFEKDFDYEDAVKYTGIGKREWDTLLSVIDGD
jgi:thymidylate synthase (FAD)